MEKERSYTFKNGVTVKLRRISQFLLSRLMVNNVDKYEIPYKIITVGIRKEEKAVPDYDNPTFKALVEEQMGRDRADTLGNISVFAVIDDVPKDTYEFYRSLAIASRGKDADASFIKSLWLLDMIEDEHELGDFQEAILGISMPTKEGIEISEEKFQDNN